MAGKRLSRIHDIYDPIPIQSKLFVDPSIDPVLGATLFPPIYRDENGWWEVLHEAKAEGRIGLDFEFSPRTLRPTVIGISSTKACAAIPADLRLTKAVYDTGCVLVGHSVIDADRLVIDQMLGVDSGLDRWDDSMIRHYLCNQDFCAAPGKEEDEDDPGALGLMNLWTAASMVTNLPVWKECRGSACVGPCPTHDVFGYCAVDSYAGLIIANECTRLMKERGIPEDLYHRLARRTRITGAMTRKGVAVDRDGVRKLEEEFTARKEDLFPFEIIKKTKNSKGTKTYGFFGPPDDLGKREFIPAPFNPQSPAQYVEYFKSNGILLKGKGNVLKGDKTAILKALEKTLKPFGLSYDAKANAVIGDYDGTLPEPVENLIKLAEVKGSGKGLKSWFDERYFGRDGLIHPRFIVPATSTGRLASSSPNFQNIPARGFGAHVRRVIVPRHPGLCLVKADYSQLELRVCLWYAGLVTGVYEKPGKDAFTWLVEQTNGAFDEAAKLAGSGTKPRDISKSVSHAGDYLEGLVLISPSEVMSGRRQQELRHGALLLFDGVYATPKWEYCGKYVGFTGSNLADRLFKDKSYGARKKALSIQEIYFRRFPSIREWHRAVSREVEETKAVKSYTGRYLQLYGDPLDNLKLAAAFKGQGGGADYAQEKLELFEAGGNLPILQVHDELVFEVPVDWSDEQKLNFMSPMVGVSRDMPGFSCPVKVSTGMNWEEKSDSNPTGLVTIGSLE